MDFPVQTHRTFRGTRKYSTVRPSAKELGGMIATGPRKSTIVAGSMAFGSTMVELTLVKILNSSATRMS